MVSITGRYLDDIGSNKKIVSACAVAFVTDDHYLNDLDQIGISD